MPVHDHDSMLDAKIIFAQRLRSWRKFKDLPLKIIAADLGVTESAFSQWENGGTFPSSKNLAVLMNYTGLPPCHFFCNDRKTCKHLCEPATERLK